jgi:hypothetical protein
VSCPPAPGQTPVLPFAALLFVGLSLSALAQQGVPVDVFAREQVRLENQRVADEAAQRGDQQTQMQRYEWDQRQRYWYEPWVEESRRRAQDAVFVPPPPPPLDGLLAEPGEAACPASLIPLLGESFFMPAASAQMRGMLSERQVTRLVDYHRTREELLAALRAKLSDMSPLPPAARARLLGEFATAQAPALQKLESDAEFIRDETSNLDDGRALLARRDSAPTDAASGRQSYYAALLAAQFQPGLSIEQRQLLLAVAYEAAAPNQTGGSPAAFFLPATSRVSWPRDPAPALAAALQAFSRERAALVNELIQSVTTVPAKTSRGELRKRYTALAALQAPRFASLHNLAEEIRTLAAESFPADDAAEANLPPDLVLRVGPVLIRQLAFEAATKRRMEELSAEFAPVQFRLGRHAEGPVIEPAPGTEASAPATALAGALQKANQWLAAGHRELAPPVLAAHAEIRHYRETLEPAEAAPLDELTASIVRIFIAQHNHRRFADYRAAVLMPGLSPAQRRLLFNAALRDLEKYRLQAMD